MSSRVAAVLLDLDGTLIASNDAHARAFVAAAERLGLPGVDYQAVRSRIGKGADKLIPEVFGFEEESDQGERLNGMKKEIFRTRFGDSLKPTPGSRELLERLRSEGIRLVIATSAGKEDLDFLLERAGVGDLIDDCTSSSDVEESKPDPDIVKAALRLADAPPTQTLMLGDTPYDVEAAQRAGIRIVAVETGGWGPEELQGAVAVYRDPAQILEHFTSSPFANSG